MMLFTTVLKPWLRPAAAWFAMAVLVGTAQAAPPADSLAGKRHTVEASVEAAAGAFIRAEQRTGPFTVPQGYRATSFKYHFADPQSGYETEKLRAGNIRAIRGGHVELDVGEQGFSLGPGDYVFVVGGMPGAMGTLSYVLDTAENVAGTDPKSGERVIDVVYWSPRYPEIKASAVYYVRDGRVRGETDIVFPDQSTDHWICEPTRQKGTFAGTISGNVISGTWNYTQLPHRMHFVADAGHAAFDRIDSGTSTYQTRTVLYADGTLSETMKGNGTVVMDWGPTAPEGVAGKRETSTYESTVPNENHPEPGTGSWKNRR